MIFAAFFEARLTVTAALVQIIIFDKFFLGGGVSQVFGVRSMSGQNYRQCTKMSQECPKNVSAIIKNVKSDGFERNGGHHEPYLEKR